MVTYPKLALRVKNLSYKSITHWPIRCSEKISLCSFQQPDRRAEIVRRVFVSFGSFKIINVIAAFLQHINCVTIKKQNIFFKRSSG